MSAVLVMPWPVAELTVIGKPVAQPRQRHRALRAKKSGKFMVQNYTPADHPVKTYKATLQAAARQAGLTNPTGDPVILEARFYLPRPLRLQTKKSPVGPIPHTSKPDLDNLLKSLQDALTGLLWVDDALICGYTSTAKYYTEKGCEPRTEIRLFLA